MKRISNTLFLPLFSLVSATNSYAAIISSSASLVDTSQNQTFESEPPALGSVFPDLEPAHSFKLAAVHFITNDNALDFNQSFKADELCQSLGYRQVVCDGGEVKLEECTYDSSYARGCIKPDEWCRNNGYTVTSCPMPRYPQNLCPYSDNYFKDCKADSDKACKEAGYGLGCETGKMMDGSQACPYDSAYKKCVCNPCSGYNYTADQASAQGYQPGEGCNSCGTMKYKRTVNECSGYKTCDCGGTAGASICYSGTVKKFSSCEECKCEPSCTSRPYCENWQYSTYEDDGCGSSCLICWDGIFYNKEDWYCSRSYDGNYTPGFNVSGRCTIRGKPYDWGEYTSGGTGWGGGTLAECKELIVTIWHASERAQWRKAGYCNENGDRIETDA